MFAVPQPGYRGVRRPMREENTISSPIPSLCANTASSDGPSLRARKSKTHSSNWKPAGPIVSVMSAVSFNDCCLNKMVILKLSETLSIAS